MSHNKQTKKTGSQPSPRQTRSQTSPQSSLQTSSQSSSQQTLSQSSSQETPSSQLRNTHYINRRSFQQPSDIRSSSDIRLSQRPVQPQLSIRQPQPSIRQPQPSVQQSFERVVQQEAAPVQQEIAPVQQEIAPVQQEVVRQQFTRHEDIMKRYRVPKSYAAVVSGHKSKEEEMATEAGMYISNLLRRSFITFINYIYVSLYF